MKSEEKIQTVIYDDILRIIPGDREFDIHTLYLTRKK